MAETFDPFIGSPIQTTRREAVCRIVVDGTDITSKIEPHLLSLHLLLGGSPYQCEIEIDDRDGRLPIPAIGAKLDIFLGWKGEGTVSVFDGQIMDIQHVFGRKQGGRRMYVFGVGANMLGKIKEPIHDHLGEGAPPGKETGDMHTLLDAAKQFMSGAGMNVAVSPSLQGIKRDYWSIGNQSPMHWVQSVANEFGAMLNIKNGNQVELIKPGETIDGSAANSIKCVWGDNLIGWRIRPMVARSTWGSVNQAYYDEKQGEWKKAAKEMGLSSPWSDAKAAFSIPAPAPNKYTADQQAEGQTNGASQFSGDGRIVINGEPRVLPTDHAIVEGARPGVDGDYFIKIVEHIYARGTGFITWLDVSPNLGAASGRRVSFGPANEPAPTPTSPGEGIALPGFPQPQVPVTPPVGEPPPINLPGFPNQ